MGYWLIKIVNENFFDSRRFVGEGNIGHIVEQVKYHGIGIPEHTKMIPESPIEDSSEKSK